MSDSERKPGLLARLFSRGVIFSAVIFGAGVVFAGAFNAALEYTNTTEFCTSCHSMQTNLNELKEKMHWKNPSGAHAGCADCHVPKDFTNKMIAKVVAAKDVFYEIMGTIDTPEKYEAHRLDMAQRVWAKMKASDSRECKSCHAFGHMDTDEQDKFARRKHEKAPERGQTCIDCHKGVAHKLPKGMDEDQEPAEPKAPTVTSSGEDNPQQGR